MDTVRTVELAERIGVSLPTVHALLDREGIARPGRGRERLVPRPVAERIIRQRAVGYSTTEISVLAALAASPLGLSSARRVAAKAGISPSAASATLARLTDRGLVKRQKRRTIWAGQARTETASVLDVGSQRWPEVRSAVRAAQLPERTVEPVDRVPKAFWHLFWNAEPATLRVAKNGAYIARRMLNSNSMAAAQWALLHIAENDLQAAATGRGTQERTRALVENWLRRPVPQSLDASPQRRLTEATPLASIRVAGIEDILAMKIKVVMDRGELRDYFDLMRIEQQTDLTVVSGMGMYVERYQPTTPDQHIYQAVRALGYFDDVEDDPGLPVHREQIETYWRGRQGRIAEDLGL